MEEGGLLRSTVGPSAESRPMPHAAWRICSARPKGRDAQGILGLALKESFAAKTAVVSSFGAESAVLLHLVAEIDPTTPILFLNTGKLFGETLRYRDRLQEQLGLGDVRIARAASGRSRAASIPKARCGRATPTPAAISARWCRSSARLRRLPRRSPAASASRPARAPT